MANYKLSEKTNSLTGIHGKHLLPGKEYPASDFMHLKEHIENKHVEEVKEVPAKEEDKKK